MNWQQLVERALELFEAPVDLEATGKLIHEWIEDARRALEECQHELTPEQRALLKCTCFRAGAAWPCPVHNVNLYSMTDEKDP